MKKALPYLLGLLGFFLAGIINGIAYVFIVAKLLDRGGDGFGVGAAVVTFPMFSIFIAVAWLVVWAVHRHTMGTMGLGRTVIISLVLGLLVSMVIAGPSGFTLKGGSTLFNYFIIDLTVVGAVVHLFIIRLTAKTGKPVAANSGT